jgi:HPt (histidine-containing phosphotransfer) domain-containing protein
MAFDHGALDATLAAAAGDDAALMRELRSAFLESAMRQLDLLKRARCDGNWHVAAMRLKGLAASFHAEDLLQAAEIALHAAPGEPLAIREVEAVLARFSRALPRDPNRI